MKKLTMLMACTASVLAMNAQMAEVSAPRPLLSGKYSHMYNPVLSEDGSRVMFTSDDFSDLRMYDFKDNVTVKLEATREQAFKARFVGNETSFDTPKVRTEGSELIITRNGVEKRYTPVECTAGYCWASMSPDGKKVVFLAAGKGLVVTDMEGRVIARPGNYESPAWFGNDHLVVQNATDDGHQLHSSQILLLSLDGSEKQELTKPESMTMTPTASIKAGKVVYSTITGRLYEMDVKLK